MKRGFHGSEFVAVSLFRVAAQLEHFAANLNIVGELSDLFCRAFLSSVSPLKRDFAASEAVVDCVTAFWKPSYRAADSDTFAPRFWVQRGGGREFRLHLILTRVGIGELLVGGGERAGILIYGEILLRELRLKHSKTCWKARSRLLEVVYARARQQEGALASLICLLIVRRIRAKLSLSRDSETTSSRRVSLKESHLLAANMQ